ncbi:proteasome maturation factor UMP1-domain-containing protein [Mrakia frigida]|uniref:Ump1p n=1 Tax=Mrakia frigida TaxID=29902 RepID=UPI003FCC0E73
MSAPLHLIPPTKSTTGAGPSVSLSSTSNAWGLHDTLRHGGPRNIVNEIKEDGFKARLNEWDQTQLNLKMQMQRNAYGLGAPLRQLMDRKIVGQDAALPQFSTSQIHLDILNGNDDSLQVEHFFNNRESANPDSEFNSFHSSMERKHKI